MDGTWHSSPSLVLLVHLTSICPPFFLLSLSLSFPPPSLPPSHSFPPSFLPPFLSPSLPPPHLPLPLPQNTTMSELKTRVDELKMENEYQLRLKDMSYGEKIKDLTDKFLQEIESLKAKNAVCTCTCHHTHHCQEFISLYHDAVLHTHTALRLIIRIKST